VKHRNHLGKPLSLSDTYQAGSSWKQEKEHLLAIWIHSMCTD